MIKALEQTLALFVPDEKPQLSPRLAASFISNARHSSIIRSADGADSSL
jgi:hypothetical protein